MTAHTPGPWEMEPMSLAMPNGPWWVHESRHHIAENVGTYNARLIVAAPDLLEALQDLVAAVETEVNEKGGGGYIPARLTDARAAIKKVTAPAQTAGERS